MISATADREGRSLGSMRNLLSILNGELADGKTTLAAASCDIERAACYCGKNYLVFCVINNSFLELSKRKKTRQYNGLCDSVLGYSGLPN